MKLIEKLKHLCNRGYGLGKPNSRTMSRFYAQSRKEIKALELAITEEDLQNVAKLSPALEHYLTKGVDYIEYTKDDRLAFITEGHRLKTNGGEDVCNYLLAMCGIDGKHICSLDCSRTATYLQDTDLLKVEYVVWCRPMQFKYSDVRTYAVSEYKGELESQHLRECVHEYLIAMQLTMYRDPAHEPTDFYNVGEYIFNNAANNPSTPVDITKEFANGKIPCDEQLCLRLSHGIKHYICFLTWSSEPKRFGRKRVNINFHRISPTVSVALSVYDNVTADNACNIKDYLTEILQKIVDSCTVDLHPFAIENAEDKSTIEIADDVPFSKPFSVTHVSLKKGASV